MENRPSRSPASFESLRFLVFLCRAVTAWMGGNRLLVGALGLLALVAAGLDRRLPFLNGPPEWRWIYSNNTFYFWPTWLKAAPLLAAGAVIIFGVFRPIGRLMGHSRQGWPAMAALIVFGFYLHALGFGLASPGGINHWGRTVLDSKTTSYYTVAQAIRDGSLPPLGETLRRYPGLLRELPLHASTHPPGAVLACVAVERAAAGLPALTDRLGRVYEFFGMDHLGYRHPTSRHDAIVATTIGILIILGGLLGAVPLWGLIRESLPGSEPVAWAAAALWVAYPALMIFEPQFDQLYPTLVLGCLWAAQRGLRARPWAWGAAAGLLFMLGVFFSFVLLFVAPMLAALAGLAAMRNAHCENEMLGKERQAAAKDRNEYRVRITKLAGGAVAACLAVEVLLRFGFGIRLFETFLAAVRLQREVHLPGVNRQYHVWLFYNLYDFLFFGGPLAVLALAWCVRVERGWKEAWALTAPAWVVFPLAALALDVSGLTPAETSRIWLFLAPGVAWAGAAELVRRAGTGWRVNLLVVLVAQLMFFFLCRAKLTFIGW